MAKIGPKEAKLQQQREENLDLPDFLKRAETPEEAAAREKKNAKLEAKRRFDDSAGLKATEPVTPMPEKIRKAIEKDLREDPVVAVEADMSAATVDAVVKPPQNAKAKKLSPVLAKALAERDKLNQSTPVEATVKTKTKAHKGNGAKKESKVDTIAALLKRKEGCTTADVLKATGWPSVSMPAQAKAAGLKLKKDKDGKVTRYRVA